MNKTNQPSPNISQKPLVTVADLFTTCQQQSALIEHYRSEIQLKTDQVISYAGLISQKDAEIKNNVELISKKDAEIKNNELLIQQLKFELARLKRMKFGRQSETCHSQQLNLFEETIEADIAAAEIALEKLSENVDMTPPPNKRKPVRRPLPADLPREEVRHDIKDCQCHACGGELHFIRDEVTEKLDYEPGVLKVIRHIRPQYSCSQCQSVIAQAMPAQVIDKGLAGTGLLAQVLIAKYIDHCPLYRQRQIYQRSGVDIAVSTMGQWVGRCGFWLAMLFEVMQADLCAATVLHADETPIKMLNPGQGKTHKAYLWAYRTVANHQHPMVIYDFQTSRHGKHAQQMLAGFQGALMVDGYAAYHALFQAPEASPQQALIKELGCWAHARRKFYDLYAANKSAVAETALKIIANLYQIEHQAKLLTAPQRQQHRQNAAKPILDEMYQWLSARRASVPDGSGIANAIDYSLKRWVALTRYIDDGHYPIDNNLLENNMRPIALGRKNWLFVGSKVAGERAAVIMSLVNSAKINGLEPYAYLKDVLGKLPTWPYSRIRELLPYLWRAP